MERTRKHLLATALALAAALILAVPALAADTSEDGYTIVSTADELMAELSEGTQKFGLALILIRQKSLVSMMKQREEDLSVLALVHPH